MTTKKEVKEVKAVKEEKKEVELLSYVITFPDGTQCTGSTPIREFQENKAKGFKNSGFQAKISSGSYSGSLMIIDYVKQVRI